MLPKKTVQLLREALQPLTAECQQHLRCFKHFSRLQTPGKGVPVNSGDDTDRLFLIHLNICAVIAGVNRHHPETPACLFGRMLFTQDRKGIVMMTGHAPSGRDRLDTVCQCTAFGLHFHGMASVKMDPFRIPLRQIQAHGSR